MSDITQPHRVTPNPYLPTQRQTHPEKYIPCEKVKSAFRTPNLRPTAQDTPEPATKCTQPRDLTHGSLMPTTNQSEISFPCEANEWITRMHGID